MIYVFSKVLKKKYPPPQLYIKFTLKIPYYFNIPYII
jgi:hypothetical protein